MSATEKLQAGRVIVLTYIVLVLLISAVTIAMYVSVKGPQALPPRIIRFVLSVCLCAWLYSGSQIAKWISVALFALGGVVALPLALRSVVSGNFEVAELTGIMALVYLSFALLLVFSPHVNAFFDLQRTRGR